MKRKKDAKIFCTALATAFLIGIHVLSYVQNTGNLGIRFINAKSGGNTYDKFLAVSFYVFTQDSSDFPPGIILPPRCTVFEDGIEKELILKPENLEVTLSDRDLAQKSVKVYNLIKDDFNPDQIKLGVVVTYFLKNLSFNFTRMSLSPAFHEKKNKEKTVSKKFQFPVYL